MQPKSCRGCGLIREALCFLLASLSSHLYLQLSCFPSFMATFILCHLINGRSFFTNKSDRTYKVNFKASHFICQKAVSISRGRICPPLMGIYKFYRFDLLFVSNNFCKFLWLTRLLLQGAILRHPYAVFHHPFLVVLSLALLFSVMVFDMRR